MPCVQRLKARCPEEVSLQPRPEGRGTGAYRRAAHATDQRRGPISEASRWTTRRASFQDPGGRPPIHGLPSSRIRHFSGSLSRALYAGWSEAFKLRGRLEKRLFLAIADRERQLVHDCFDQFKQAISGHTPSGFGAEPGRLEVESHATTCISGLYQGLKTLLADPTPPGITPR